MPATTAGLQEHFYALNNESGTLDSVSITRHSIANADEALRALINEIPTFIPRWAKLGEQFVHMCLTGKLLTFVMRQPTLKLLTHWRVIPPDAPRQPARLSPAFRQSGTGDTIETAPVFTPPDNMRLFFMSHYINHPAGWIYDRSSIVAVRINTSGDDKSFYKVPLPNIFGNGKLCLGAQTPTIQTEDQITRGDLFSSFTRSVGVFNNAMWNGDLLSEQNLTTIDQSFRFSAEDNQTQLPMTQPEWWRTWPKISNADFNAVPFHSLA